MKAAHPDRALSLLLRGDHGTLSTHGWEGHPHGSLVAFAVSEDGFALLLLSGLAAHAKNLAGDRRASLLVTDLIGGPAPLTRKRVTLLGTVRPSDHTGDRETYLSRHPSAAQYIDFGDFQLYRLHVERGRYIEGFGEMSWFDGAAWKTAQADPLASAAVGIVTHMNDDHADALLLYTHVFASCPEATEVVMDGIDQHGFDVRVLQPKEHRHRIAFEEPVLGSGAARRALVAMVKKARGVLDERLKHLNDDT
jgi:heme iron utilization protein